MKKFLVLFFCIAIGVLIDTSLTAWAEEVFDYRDDTHSYCQKVAELNSGIMGSLYTQSRGEAVPELVLFRAATTLLDFEKAAFQTDCVVYGPEGFSVLLCDDPDAAIDWLRAQDGVLCAEVDSVISACSTAREGEDIAFQSWAAETMGFDDFILFAGQCGNGSATVAVIDSGVYRHSLISPKILQYGYDYVDNDSDPTNDLNGHGTRVAGIVADCTRGLPVYIYPIRVLDAGAGGKISNVISAVLEAANANVDVINLSLSSFTQSEMLESAIRNAVSSGATVVVAAGNYACDASEITPANMRDAGVIVVGSAEIDGSRSSFSNYGVSVDVYAYGRGIVSCSRSGGYVADTGTSMAAPHVSALCAMLELTHPSISPEGVEARIKAAAAGSIRIASARSLVPQRLSLSLSSMQLNVNDQLNMPMMALPVTSQEAITYESTDADVVEISNGVLTARRAGEAQVIVRCRGLEPLTFAVTVADMDVGSVALPSELTAVEAEAFHGLKTHDVMISQGVLSIGDHAFDGGQIDFISLPDTVDFIGENNFSGAVIICPAGSFAHEYALERSLQCILLMPE